jgi:hypothetical protein
MKIINDILIDAGIKLKEFRKFIEEETHLRLAFFFREDGKIMVCPSSEYLIKQWSYSENAEEDIIQEFKDHATKKIILQSEKIEEGNGPPSDCYWSLARYLSHATRTLEISSCENDTITARNAVLRGYTSYGSTDPLEGLKTEIRESRVTTAADMDSLSISGEYAVIRVDADIHQRFLVGVREFTRLALSDDGMRFKGSPGIVDAPDGNDENDGNMGPGCC